MKTIDIKFSELCEEIDYWKNRANKYEKLYNEAVDEKIDLVHGQIKHNEAMIGGMLALVLSKDILPKKQGAK